MFFSNCVPIATKSICSLLSPELFSIMSHALLVRQTVCPLKWLFCCLLFLCQRTQLELAFSSLLRYPHLISWLLVWAEIVSLPLASIWSSPWVLSDELLKKTQVEREASLRKPETGKRCEKGGPLNPLVTQTLKLTVAEGHPTPGDLTRLGQAGSLVERSHGFGAGCPLAREKVSPAPVWKHYSVPWEEAPARCRTLRFLCDFTQATWQTARPVCLHVWNYDISLANGVLLFKGTEMPKKTAGGRHQVRCFSSAPLTDAWHQDGPGPPAPEERRRAPLTGWRFEISSHLTASSCASSIMKKTCFRLSLRLLLKASTVVELPPGDKGAGNPGSLGWQRQKSHVARASHSLSGSRGNLQVCTSYTALPGSGGHQNSPSGLFYQHHLFKNNSLYHWGSQKERDAILKLGNLRRV